ncbi:Abi family protein [Mobiluncus mulieris]|uniref:Abi family protein n=1 Tax=Mobiluncus mulieris TaxID=2052 RepID=A0A7Y0U3S3_9ACTO|nr:Abi family protein [Mobiluncus mulieris]
MELKPPLPLEQQIQAIKGKGFIVDNYQQASEFLAQVGYYRLRAYFLPFRHQDGYQPGISFRRITKLYEFDTELRTWLFRIIGDIECYTRNQIATHLALAYGAECYMDADTFDVKRHRHEPYLKRIDSLIYENRNTSVVKHHRATYGGHFPIWVIIEFFSTGMLSFTYADLKRQDRKRIARAAFNTGDQQLESWLRAFTELRNKCAHYTRLYFWRFTTVPRQPRDSRWKMDNSLFSQLYMLSRMHPNQHSWRKEISRLEGIIQLYQPYMGRSHLGFPRDWKALLSPEGCACGIQ